MELTCESCGGNRFDIPEATDDSAIIVCGDCYAPYGTVGDVKRQVERAVIESAR
jgi:ribosome-binding protein aMBF1 (putative translation factor)